MEYLIRKDFNDIELSCICKEGKAGLLLNFGSYMPLIGFVEPYCGEQGISLDTKKPPKDPYKTSINAYYQSGDVSLYLVESNGKKWSDGIVEIYHSGNSVSIECRSGDLSECLDKVKGFYFRIHNLFKMWGYDTSGLDDYLRELDAEEVRANPFVEEEE